MATYSAISAGEKDADSPITVGLIEKLDQNPHAIAEGASGAPRILSAALNQVGGAEAVTRDTIRANAVGSTEIDTDAVGQGEIAAGSVHQSELDTTLGTLSAVTTGPAMVTLPGGQYGFWIQHYNSDTTGTAHEITIHSGISSAPASYTTSIVVTGTSSDIAYVRQRYITSSPPYDLGDGDIPLFVFVKYKSNNIAAIYSAEAPPWAYNGPTIIVPDRVTKDGRKFRNVRAINEETGELEINEVEIDMELKNRDMTLIPHPFHNLENNEHVVLLDPINTLYLREIALAGEDINELIHNDYIRISNSDLNRVSPSDVSPKSFSWKNSRSRVGEAIKDKRLKRGAFADN